MLIGANILTALVHHHLARGARVSLAILSVFHLAILIVTVSLMLAPPVLLILAVDFHHRRGRGIRVYCKLRSLGILRVFHGMPKHFSPKTLVNSLRNGTAHTT